MARSLLNLLCKGEFCPEVGILAGNVHPAKHGTWETACLGAELMVQLGPHGHRLCHYFRP
jgi:hypothetical protein